ncbi:MAG: hypothetical protein JOY69_09590 [Candidatus Eremiobacteraeota bacterium]|nr:hypothetical protein [Candidatus Eremiobacteraeota bacterium]
MKFRLDPRDWHYRERLTGSTLASLILHALLALLLFSIVASASQEGATENVQGGSVVTLERRTPAIVANAPAAVRAALPVAHVPRIAPVRHAALSQPQTQRLPQNRHELVHEAPTAPPNPRPLPQQTVQPNPQPTQNVYEVRPSTELPAAPVNVPTVAPVAVAVKSAPSTAPSPAPTAVPTAAHTPRPAVPTAAPTARATPAPIASAAPSAAPVAVRASALPSASPAPAARASLAPAPRAGVPSPSATAVAAAAKTQGTAASPGPKGIGSPGPRAGTGPKSQTAPARPIQLHPTPSPVPRSTKTPATPPNINARLRSLLPNNPVNPSSKQYAPSISLHGSLEPTPPPAVIAQTKYLYRSRPGGTEARVEMWVTAIRKAGITTICTGWLVRYPLNQAAPHAGDFAPANGTQVTVGGGRGTPAVLPPIVEGIVTEPCEGRLLVPYTPSPAPSP